MNTYQGKVNKNHSVDKLPRNEQYNLFSRDKPQKDIFQDNKVNVGKTANVTKYQRLFK